MIDVFNRQPSASDGYLRRRRTALAAMDAGTYTNVIRRTYRRVPRINAKRILKADVKLGVSVKCPQCEVDVPGGRIGSVFDLDAAVQTNAGW
jgi:hypothetical protein